MKRFIRKVKDLQQHASDLKEYMEKLPPKVAEIRQAVNLTSGQLQQLRDDVQTSVSDLKADTEDRLMQALKEINGGEEVFRQAGYELVGVDMEISPVHKLTVHFEKIMDVQESSQRFLLTANQKRKTIHALILSLIQADQMSREVDLSNLSYRKLILHVGPIPSVRLCWRADEVFEEEAVSSVAIPTQSPVAKTVSTPIKTSKSFLGKDSFFGKRYKDAPPAISEPPATGASNVPAPAVELPSTEDSKLETAEQAPAATGDWKKDALARFKVMPGVSKYKR